ncbi:hypothetical protein D3C76_1844050 [compost metagenome]
MGTTKAQHRFGLGPTQSGTAMLFLTHGKWDAQLLDLCPEDCRRPANFGLDPGLAIDTISE